MSALTALLLRPPIIENGIEIPAEPEAVFDYCTDLQREHEWNPALVEAEKLTDGPVGPGTRHQLRLQGVGEMTTENVSFDWPLSWASYGMSRWLDVEVQGEVLQPAVGAR